MVLSIERWKGKVAVVTGASSGIGATIAEELVKAGIKVVGLARRKERIEELAKKLEGESGQLFAAKADVTKEDDVVSAFEWIRDNLGPVYILINNAGIARFTSLGDGDVKMWKDVLDTNVLGLCIVTREAVRDMRANKTDGQIIHINSALGHGIGNNPQANVYAASKHSVVALTETLRRELLHYGNKIRVTSLSPGLVQTEMVEATYKGSGLSDIPDFTKKELLKYPSMHTSDVADAVTYILSTPPHIQVQELKINPI